MSAEMQAESAPDKSIAVMKRFLAKSPSSVNGHITLARLYLQQNDMDSARAEFEVLRKVAPTDPRVPLALGLTSLQARSYDDAERYLKEYLQMAEKSPAANPDIAYQYLAQIAEEKKDYPAAIDWLDRIEDPRLTLAAQAKRGQLLARMGKLDDAQAVFGDMLADAEDIPDPAQRALRMTAIRQAEVAALMDGKAYDRARKVLDERVKAEPDNADWIYELAMLDEREKRYDSMERGLLKVIALQPDQKQGYNALGYSLADRNERLPEARKLLERASELGPDDPTSWTAWRGSSTVRANCSPRLICSRTRLPRPRGRNRRASGRGALAARPARRGTQDVERGGEGRAGKSDVDRHPAPLQPERPAVEVVHIRQARRTPGPVPGRFVLACAIYPNT
jgi:tetratricopeptide (TPR) repeat protein